MHLDMSLEAAKSGGFLVDPNQVCTLWTQQAKALRQRCRSTSRRRGGLSASPSQAAPAPFRRDALPEDALEELGFSASLLQEQLAGQ